MDPKVIENLQKKLDEKQINPKDLNPNQRKALDKAFREGTLKGYKNVGEMRAERAKAAVDIAQDIERKLAPLTPQSRLGLGIRRGTMVAAGDIIGSFYPYVKDSKLLRKEALKAAIGGQRVGYIPRVRGVEGIKVFNGFKNLVKNIAPGGGPFKLFAKTGKLLDNLVTGSRALATGKALTSQALRTELKSQILGATGAATGSVAFDLANFPARFITSAGEDLSKLSENELDKMSPVERTTTMAIRNFKTALLWNTLAFGGIGAMLGLGRIVRNGVGLNPKNLKFQENVKTINAGGEYGAVHGTSKEPGVSQALAGHGGSLGVLPGSSLETGKYRKKVIGGGVAGLTGATDTLAPLYGAGELATTAGVQINQVYKFENNLINQLYDQIGKEYQNISNIFTEFHKFSSRIPVVDTMKGTMEVPIFPARGITEYKDAILAAGAAPGEAAKILAERGFDTIQSVSPAMLRHANQLDVYIKEWQKALGQGEYITYSQLKLLREEFTKAYNQALKPKGGGTTGKFSDAESIREFMRRYEMDMLALTGNRDDMLKMAPDPRTGVMTSKNPKVAQFYNFLLNDPGVAKQLVAEGQIRLSDGSIIKTQQELANAFVDKLMKGYTTVKQKHELANLTYSSMMNKYAPSSLRNDQLQKYKNALGYDIATQKSILGGFNNHTVNSNKAFKEMADTIFIKTVPDPEVINQFARYVGAEVNPQLLAFARANKIDVNQMVAQGKWLMRAINKRRFTDAGMQSVVVAEVMGKPTYRPLFEEQSRSVRDINKYLMDNSASYRKHYEETAEVIQNSMGITGRATDLDDLTTIRYALKPKYLMLYDKALESRLTMPLAAEKVGDKWVAPDVPKNLEKLRLMAFEGKGFTDPVLSRARRPDFTGTPETVLSIKEAWRRNPKGVLGMSQKLSASEEKALTNLLDGEEKLVMAAKAASQTYRNNVHKFSNFERFDFNKYEEMLGLNSAAGKKSMLRMFESMGIKNPKAHLQNVETFINQLRRSHEAPAGSPSTWLSRAIMIGVATGGMGVALGGVAGGLMGTMFLWAGLKYSSRMVNSPAVLKYWTNTYPEMERRYIDMVGGSLRRPVDAPPRRDRLADFLNYAFGGDPDAPYVTPDNITDERIIKYLLESPVHEPHGSMLYEEQPQAVKELFDPDLTTIRKLSPQELHDVSAAVEGMNLGKKRDTLLEQLDSPAGAKILAEDTNLKNFIENPPTANQTINPIQRPQSANTVQRPQGANTYRNLFPGDNLGAAIAESQGTKPTLQIPGRPTYNA